MLSFNRPAGLKKAAIMACNSVAINYLAGCLSRSVNGFFMAIEDYASRAESCVSILILGPIILWWMVKGHVLEFY